MKLFPCGCELVEHAPDAFPDGEPGFVVIWGMAECSFAARSKKDGGGEGEYTLCPNWGKGLRFSDGTPISVSLPEPELSPKLKALLEGQPKRVKKAEDDNQKKLNGKQKQAQRTADREQAKEVHHQSKSGGGRAKLALAG